MRIRVSLSVSLLVLMAAAGCSSNVVYKTSLPANPAPPKNIAIFFDGTHNEIATDTNVKKLHSLVTLRADTNVAALYIEGVGPAADVVGMATGAGIGERVRIAYRFLMDNYQPNDKIYIFGFSRGAYAARLLASLLYHAGVVDNKDQAKSAEITKSVYAALHDSNEVTDETCNKYPVSARHCQFASTLAAKKIKPGSPVTVELLGLWDTVEALGVPDEMARLEHKNGGQPFEVNVNGSNDHYGDQLCNVRRAYHALSLDDDREWIFTPLLLTRQHLLDECKAPHGGYHDPDLIHGWDQKIRPGRLHEVWFSGAHSDVGGGYDESLLSGVSLNWMMRQMAKDGIKTALLPADAAVPEDPYGSSHNPEAGPWSLIYHAMTRNIGAYVTDDNQFAGYDKRICIHDSVFKRRAVIAPAPNENHQLALLHKEQEACLVADNAEGASRPQRLKQADCLAAKPLKQIRIMSWPECSQEKK